jgi:hypothetical protein
MRKYETEVFSKPSSTDLARIVEADCIFIAAANTGPSISSPPMALSPNAFIGEGTMMAAEYKRVFGCGVKASNRLRAVCLSTSDGFEASYDLDMLDSLELRDLIMAVMSRPIVSYSVQDFLGYMLLSVPALNRPPVLIDLAVFVRALAPQLPYCLARKMVFDAALAVDFAGKPQLSLQAICAALALDLPPAVFRPGPVWQLVKLSEPAHSRKLGGVTHLDALQRRVGAVQEAFVKLVGNGPIAAQLQAIQRMPGGDEFFAAFADAPFELARIHARGMPVDPGEIDAVRRSSIERIPGQVEVLVAQVEPLSGMRAALLDVGALAGDEVRRALGAYCAQSGIVLPVDDDGLPKIGFDALTLTGAATLPGMQAWSALDACKRDLKSASEMKTHSVMRNGLLRMHPVLAVTALSGRTTCREINAQALGKRAKCAIKAGPGNVLIEADAGAIEIRLAAAVAVSAFSRASASGLETLTDASTKLGYWYQCVLEKGMPLVELLRAGKCPHDHIAAGLAINREEAKAANFGMLYLISPAGLHRNGLLKGIQWTRRQAEEVHSGWREQFPEIAFSAAWTLAETQERDSVRALLPLRYGSGSEEQDVWLHQGQTLGGRPLVSHDDRIINLISQGSGATVLLKAISELPAHLKELVIMTVHDSIVLEAPTDKAQLYAVELARSMAQTIAQYLRPHGIPSVVEASVGPRWSDLVKTYKESVVSG